MTELIFPCPFGGYVLLLPLARGGMAELFVAIPPVPEPTGKYVVLKMLLDSYAEDTVFVDMLVDEARLAGRLHHPNIARTLELGRAEGRVYLAMELVRGRSLSDVLRRAFEARVDLSPELAFYVLAKAARGLDFAHRLADSRSGAPLDIVHRDVSPQNIMLTMDGEVKVVDFGVAKANQRRTKTQTGVLKGKFSYMSPEQARGRAIDRRSDVFALGAVLYEMLRGRMLFDGETDLEVLDKVRDAKLPQLREDLAFVRREGTDILERALAREPDDRIAWASELADELEPLCFNYHAADVACLMERLYAADMAKLDAALERAEQSANLMSASTAAKEQASRATVVSGFSSGQNVTETINLDLAVDPEALQVRASARPMPQRIVPIGELLVPRARPKPRRRTALFVWLALALIAAVVAIGVYERRGKVAPRVAEVAREPLVRSDAATTGHITVLARGKRPLLVFVDGRYVGKTPLQAHPVRVGERRVRVVTRHGREWQTDVTVRGAHTSKRPLVVRPQSASQ